MRQFPASPIGLAYETDGQLEKGLEVISDALRP